MEKVDINLIRFDFDLTFAVVIMNADGTIYRRYGGRDHDDADGYLGMESLVRALKETLQDHVEYSKKPSPPKRAPVRTINDIPAWRSRTQKPNCVHCHMIHEAERAQAQKDGRWSRDRIWLYPMPGRLGIEVDADDQASVKKIEPKSPAAEAKLRAGDRLVRIDGVRVRTLLDIQWALELSSGSSMEVEFERAGKTESAKLKLKAGWKQGGPLDLSWRASMWGLSPQPGFGGKKLTPAELKQAGLPEDGFAFRVNYIVDWGDKAHLGRNVKQAGVQKGDIVLSTNGETDFVSELHWQAWFRLTLKSGSKVPLEVWRAGKRVTLTLPVVE
jgi:serine protease Do